MVEAVVEHLDLKRAIFQQLDEIVRPDAVLATNTSSLSVTEISAATSHPGRVIGMHFFNPAPVQKFVEVIRTVVTEPEVVQDVQELARKLGKNPVAAGDKAGFIANALLFGYLNHAVSMYETHYASREDIDAAMRLGCGYPMGPLALLDLIGLDTAYEILDTMYRQGRNRLHAPAPILKQMVTAGLAGPQDRARLLHLRGSRTARSSSTMPRRPTRRRAPQLRREIARVGVVGSGHDGDRHRRGLRQGRVSTSPMSPAARTRSTSSARRVDAQPREGRPARQARPPTSATRRSATLHGSHRPRGPCRPSTWSSRRSPRTWRSRRRCSRTSTRSVATARSSPPPRRRCRSSSSPR